MTPTRPAANRFAPVGYCSALSAPGWNTWSVNSRCQTRAASIIPGLSQTGAPCWTASMLARSVCTAICRYTHTSKLPAAAPW